MTTNPKVPRGYTNEEAASILSRAMDRQYGEGRISHDELLETAREIGVSTSELEASVVEETRVRAEKLVRDEQQQRRLSQFWFSCQYRGGDVDRDSGRFRTGRKRNSRGQGHHCRVGESEIRRHSAVQDAADRQDVGVGELLTTRMQRG
jgi:hypothetical protein